MLKNITVVKTYSKNSGLAVNFITLVLRPEHNIAAN